MTGARRPAYAAVRTAATAEVLVVEDCPSHAGAERAFRAALESAGLRDVAVRTVVVTSPEHAAEVGFAGSPSFHLDGRDLFPAAATAATGDGAPPDMASLSCRLYATAAGVAGLPEQDALVAAVAALVGVADIEGSTGGER